MPKHFFLFVFLCTFFFLFAPVQASTGNLFVDQACPCSSPWKNHGQYVSCVAKAVQKIVPKKERGLLISKAASSSCGQKGDIPAVSAVIGPAGGKIESPNLATLIFPPGSFAENTTVSIEATSDPLTDEIYQDTAAIFLAGVRAQQEIRVQTTSLPIGTTTIQITVPPDFLRKVPLGSEIQLFAQIYQENDLEVLDIFELLPSTFDPITGLLTAEAPDVIFTDKRQPGLVEAVLIIGTTPTAPNALNSTLRAVNSWTVDPNATNIENQPEYIQKSADLEDASVKVLIPSALVALAEDQDCDGVTIGSPLDGDVTIPCIGSPATNPPCLAHDFHELRNRSTGPEPHGALDIATETGTPIMAAHDGKITRVKVDPNGYGLYIIISGGAGQTLYGHLSEASVTLGDTVKKGGLIGKSGGEKGTPNAGSSKSPHLHFEYAPNGEILTKNSRSDPVPCLKGNVVGSITVRDNGSLADDAFQVAVDGNIVCQTSIGASNTCGTGQLRPGSHTLTLTAIIAPDDVGTFEITLSKGVTFADGSTSRSGVLSAGGSTSFEIIATDPNNP